MSSGLVLLMVPGLGLFYSGISERCSAVSMMWMSMLTTALIGVQVRSFGTFAERTAALTGRLLVSGSYGATALLSQGLLIYGVRPTALRCITILLFLGETSPGPRSHSYFTHFIRECSPALRMNHLTLPSHTS
jgi:hypothetical protein